MRFVASTVTAFALFGGVLASPGAEAASNRHGQEARNGRVASHPTYRGSSHSARARTALASTMAPDPQTSLAFLNSVAPLAPLPVPRIASSSLRVPTAAVASNGLPFAYNAYATGLWAGETSFGGRPRGGLQCVPYARQVSGIEIRGNARYWWNTASGRYDRGQRPEPGAVLAFRASGGMRNGHVAVISRVFGPRHVQIDHANWEGPGMHKGSIHHNVNVIDVSPANDWTAVRVQIGYDEGSFGRTYPTHGFIYNRGDSGTLYAQTPRLQTRVLEEVAEMPAAGAGRRR
jgi:surface antigen